MDYLDNYSDWLWKILVVTDESDCSEDLANTIISLLETLKDPPDVESSGIYGKNPVEKCRKILFILDETKRTAEENNAVDKWLRGLSIDPRKSEKYMILLLKSKDEGRFNKQWQEFADSQIIQAYEGAEIYSWWPKVIRFLCKTRNWDNSAYILLHAGFGHDIHDVKRMTKHIEKVEEHKKTIEIMLGQFGPRNLHKTHWNGGSMSSRPVSATEVQFEKLGRTGSRANRPDVSDHPLQRSLDSRQSKDKLSSSRTADDICCIESFIANNLSEEPLRPSWAVQKKFASVVPIFIIMKPDITVAEKCCLTDYAREFPKTHFLCVSQEPPSDYIKLVSSKVYGSNDLINFIFYLLRELKVISSIKSRKKDSCVCVVV